MKRIFVFLANHRLWCRVFSGFAGARGARGGCAYVFSLYESCVARGIRAPIFKDGDNLAEMVPQLIINAANAEGYSIRNRDVIALTESIVARTQGNYATVEDIKNDVIKKIWKAARK